MFAVNGSKKGLTVFQTLGRKTTFMKNERMKGRKTSFDSELKRSIIHNTKSS